MLLYRLIATLATAYTLLAIAIVLVERIIVYIYGEGQVLRQINRLAGTKNVVAFEIYSWFSVAVWFVLVLPWVDLFTFQKFTHFATDDHLRTTIETYFGPMNETEALIFFAVAFANILGVKAAVTLAELAGTLRRGRVRMSRLGFFRMFSPE